MRYLLESFSDVLAISSKRKPLTILEVSWVFALIMTSILSAMVQTAADRHTGRSE
jgi:hypothetical protein